jgi:hypothetical protein
MPLNALLNDPKKAKKVEEKIDKNIFIQERKNATPLRRN